MAKRSRTDDGDVLVLEAEDGHQYGWGVELDLKPSPGRALTIDAAGLQFATTPFILRLQALIDVQVGAGVELRMLPPESSDVANYLSRMHVGSGVPGLAAGLPHVRERERDDVLVPVSRLSQESEVDRLNEALGPLLRGHFDDVAALADPLHMAISELCGNAVTHGANPIGAYVVAQRYERPQRRTVLAVADLGPGIAAHIRTAYPELQQDVDAVTRALELGVTATGKPHRGNGFYWVMTTAADAGVRAAELDVRTGFARVRQRLAGDGSLNTQSWRPPSTSGTWLRFELGAT